jgi:hypothetical protein
VRCGDFKDFVAEVTSRMSKAFTVRHINWICPAFAVGQPTFLHWEFLHSLDPYQSFE